MKAPRLIARSFAVPRQVGCVARIREDPVGDRERPDENTEPVRHPHRWTFLSLFKG